MKLLLTAICPKCGHEKTSYSGNKYFRCKHCGIHLEFHNYYRWLMALIVLPVLAIPLIQRYMCCNEVTMIALGIAVFVCLAFLRVHFTRIGVRETQMRFRPAKGVDAREMLAVQFAAVHHTTDPRYSYKVRSSWAPKPDEQRRKVLAYLLAKESTVSEIAMSDYNDENQDDTLLGFCLAIPEQSRLHSLYVTPGYAGTGIGSRLLRTVEERCHKAGVDMLEVNVPLNAEGFYRANGYTPIRETTETLADGTSMGVTLMAKRLAPAA